MVKIYAAEVLLALESMHKREIIFRDLKPANVVLDSEGHAKVTDFGLSKQTKEFSKSFCGSIAYMAPEMLFKYFSLELGRGTASLWIGTCSESSSMSCWMACHPTTA